MRARCNDIMEALVVCSLLAKISTTLSLASESIDSSLLSLLLRQSWDWGDWWKVKRWEKLIPCRDTGGLLSVNVLPPPPSCAYSEWECLLGSDYGELREIKFEDLRSMVQIRTMQLPCGIPVLQWKREDLCTSVPVEGLQYSTRRLNRFILWEVSLRWWGEG